MGQLQIMAKETDLDSISKSIKSNREPLVALGNSFVPNLVNRGGGITEITFRSFGKTRVGNMGSVDILVNTADAMGANLVNKICEGMSHEIEKITKGRVNIKILSNLSDKRLARSCCKVSVDSQYLFPDYAEKIVEAQVLAENDPYRATTHNKGVMNGIDALAIATGQDFRAIEAGAHAYAARSGKYRALTNWYIEDNFLIGSIELPMAVGIVGGITKFHKTVETSFKILGVKSYQELAGIMASVGLAQNFAALLALVSKGIDASHMPLHKRKDGAA
jgi:hydroxymethylglutaryl-CoA reductase